MPGACMSVLECLSHFFFMSRWSCGNISEDQWNSDQIPFLTEFSTFSISSNWKQILAPKQITQSKPFLPKTCCVRHRQYMRQTSKNVKCSCTWNVPIKELKSHIGAGKERDSGTYHTDQLSCHSKCTIPDGLW